MRSNSIRRLCLLLTCHAAALAACDGGPPTGSVAPPVMTVTGVAEGGRYAAPVEIGIAVDRGSYEATLNGETVIAPVVVARAGEYELMVRARYRGESSDTTLAFTVVAPGSRLLVRVLDLGANAAGGGGDAILLTDSSAMGQYHALVDAGPAGSGASDPGYVARRLLSLGVDTLSLLVLTHAHSDHYAGMSEVLGRIHVRRFVYNGQLRSLQSYLDLVQTARTRADTVIVPDSLHRFRLAPGDSSVTLTIVPPLATHLSTDVDRGSYPDEGGMLNEGSVGILATLGAGSAFELFLTGDGEVAANQRWKTAYGALTHDLDVLKIGHHGANNAVFDNGFDGPSTWLAHTAPEAVLVSANGTTHPRIRALAYLDALPAELFCTSAHGEVTLRASTDGAFTLSTARQGSCAPGTEASTLRAP